MAKGKDVDEDSMDEWGGYESVEGAGRKDDGNGKGVSEEGQ